MSMSFNENPEQKRVMIFPLINLWNKRTLIFHFALMNIKIRFKGTYLGFAWNAVEPTLTFIVLYIVFTSIRARPGENFGIYLLIGVIIYHVFTRGTLAGLSSLTTNGGILKSVSIRREIFPVISTTATALLIFVEIAVFFGLLPFFQYVPPWTVVFLPIVFGLLLLVILGFSYILSIIHVYFRDIAPFWGVFVHALFFVTPIIWYLDEVEGILLDFHKINPVGQLVELAHNLVVFGEIPPLNDWMYSIVFAVGIFLGGYIIFQKFQDRVVEEL